MNSNQNSWNEENDKTINLYLDATGVQKKRLEQKVYAMLYEIATLHLYGRYLAFTKFGYTYEAEDLYQECISSAFAVIHERREQEWFPYVYMAMKWAITAVAAKLDKSVRSVPASSLSDDEERDAFAWIMSKEGMSDYQKEYEVESDSQMKDIALQLRTKKTDGAICRQFNITKAQLNQYKQELIMNSEEF